MRNLLKAHRLLSVAVLLASLIGTSSLGVQAADQGMYCAVDQPESVLRCLVRAFGERDLDLYRQLLAPDCRFVSGGDENSWGSDVEINTHAKIFANPSIKLLTLSISDGYQVAPGPEPDTWVISGVVATLALEIDRDGKTKHFEVVTRGAEFQVRRVLEPVAHFVIYRWWQPVNQ